MRLKANEIVMPESEEWISIQQEAPPENILVLLYDVNLDPPYSCGYLNGEENLGDPGAWTIPRSPLKYIYPTHWKPLPDPPPPSLILPKPIAELVWQYAPEVAKEFGIPNPKIPNPQKNLSELKELSYAAYIVLASNGIKTIPQLIKKSESDLLKIRGFGRIRLANVKAVLDNCGLSLGMINQEPPEA